MKKQKRGSAMRAELHSPSLPERGKISLHFWSKLYLFTLLKKEKIRMRKKPHFPWCMTHKGRVFYSPVMAFLKRHGDRIRQSWDHTGWGRTGISWFPNNSCVLWLNRLSSLLLLISICRMGVSGCRTCKLPWGCTHWVCKKCCCHGVR